MALQIRGEHISDAVSSVGPVGVGGLTFSPGVDDETKLILIVSALVIVGALLWGGE